MTDNKSKSIGSTEKVDLSLESPQDAGYLSLGYFKMASSKSGLINKIGVFWPIIVMTGHKLKSSGSRGKLYLSLESPQGAEYLSASYFQRAPRKSGLINKNRCFLAKTGKTTWSTEKFELPLESP